MFLPYAPPNWRPYPPPLPVDRQAVELETLKTVWFKLNYLTPDDQQMVKGPFQIALPMFVNPFQTYLGPDGVSVSRANELLRKYEVYLQEDKIKSATPNGWEYPSVIKLGLSDNYLAYLTHTGENGMPRVYEPQDFNYITVVWKCIVEWVTEICHCRPVPLDDWIIMNENIGNSELNLTLTTSSKVDPLGLLRDVWKDTYRDLSVSIPRGNLFYAERSQAVPQICGLLDQAIQDPTHPSGEAKHQLEHWLNCPLIVRRELKREDCLALAVCAWKMKLDEWALTERPADRLVWEGLPRPTDKNRTLMAQSIDEWAKNVLHKPPEKGHQHLLAPHVRAHTLWSQ